MKTSYLVFLLFLLSLAGCDGPQSADAADVYEAPYNSAYEADYEDEYLSFNYPDNVQLYYQQSYEGRDFRTITFLSWNDNVGAYTSTGLELTYLHIPEEGEETIDEMRAELRGLPYPETQTYVVDGRRALRVTTGDFSGDTFDLYIPGEGSDTVAYQLSGHFLKEDVSEDIVNMLIDTLDLKK